MRTRLILVVLIALLLPGPLRAANHAGPEAASAPAVLVQQPSDAALGISREGTEREADETIVSPPLGRVRGRKTGEVVVWRGIPYAQPPIGALRFAAPVPVLPWTGIRDALDFGPAAPQPPMSAARYAGEEANQSEDCLRLNIWARPGISKRPVMVWIHGGAYLSGAGSSSLYDGTDLAAKGAVVVVTLNYRLGALGGMHFADLAQAAGVEGFVDNPALRDQIAALAWIRDNIAAFGGDPGNVTIFGESAGGSSVITLLCSPRAKGLFHRAIAQSPAPACIYGRETGTAYAKQLLIMLGLTPAEVGRLRELPVEDLVRAARTLMDLNAVVKPGSIPFGPTWGTEALPLDPLSAAASGLTARVPLIIGTNRDEATLFELTDPPILPITETLFQRMLDLTTPPKTQQRILSAYPAYPSRCGVIAAATDAIFRQPATQFADAYSRFAPTWVYRFDYVAPLPGLKRMGATHSGEIVHVFHTYGSRTGRLLSICAAPGTKRRLGEALQASWVAFALAGDPNGAIASGDPWPAYETQRRATRIFGAKIFTAMDPDPARREIWQGVTLYR